MKSEKRNSKLILQSPEIMKSEKKNSKPIL